jgi:hypothetical protein
LPVGDIVQRRAVGLMGLFTQRMMGLRNRIGQLQRMIDAIGEKAARIGITVGAMEDLSLYDRVLKPTPIRPLKRFAARSPLTPSIGAATDQTGLTPRINACFNFEPSAKRFGWQ